MSGINQDVWTNEIAEQLFPDNSIVHESTNDDMYATADEVNLPIAGANPKVLVNNPTYPIAAVQRVDAVLKYPMDKLETELTAIVGLEELSLSYDKRQSVLASHINSLNTKSATYVIGKWAPKTSAGGIILKTTGADRAAIVKGATGLRKSIQLDDFINVVEILDAADVDEDGRIAYFPAKMKNDLFRIADIRKKETFGIEILPSGIVSKIMGFKIMYRSEAAVYNAAGTASLDMLAASPSVATSNAGALFYHPDFVRKAFYAVRANISQPSAEYSGGQTMNAIMKMGASPSYPDFRGIVALVEDTV